MCHRHSLIQRPKATVIIFGLLATLAIPVYGHNPPSAESCKGWECDNPGQLCGPGIPGAETVRYICTEEGKWELFPHLPHPEHISVLTHHGHIHPEDLDAEVAAATADMEAEVAAAAERKYTQADLDAQVAEATADMEAAVAAATADMEAAVAAATAAEAALEGMVPAADMEAAVAAAAERKYTQADLDAQVAEATAGMYTQEDLDAQVGQSQCVATLAPEELRKANCSDVQTYLNAYDDVSIHNHDHCGRTGIRLSTAWQSNDKNLYDVTCNSLTTYFDNYEAVSNHYTVNCGMTVPGGAGGGDCQEQVNERTLDVCVYEAEKRNGSVHTCLGNYGLRGTRENGIWRLW